MRKAKRWVYWCDFCGKSGRSASHMTRHEKSCTMNSDRVCRMCKDYGDGTPQAKMGDMLKALELAKIEEIEEDRFGVTVKIKNEKEAIERLRELSNNCPMCMMATIKQYTKYPGLFSSFKFNEEKAKWWEEYNESQLQKDYGY